MTLSRRYHFIPNSCGTIFLLLLYITSSRYNTSYATLGTIVFICNIVAGVSALFAARLADNIGLILTMVVTHVPSNVLLILVPLMPTETLAIVMLCARFCISQMDSPTRNAYVQGVVDPDERSAANGVTNVVRSIGASSGPYLAGLLYSNPRLMNYPWIIAGLLKILYDFLLLYNMYSVRPDVEKDKAKIVEREREITEQVTETDEETGESSALQSHGDSEDILEEMEDKLIYADVTDQLIDKTSVDI